MASIQRGSSHIIQSLRGDESFQIFEFDNGGGEATLADAVKNNRIIHILLRSLL